MHRLLLLLTVLLLGAVARAQLAYVSENDLLGQADLIVVGTIVSETRDADVPNYMAMVTQIKVTQTLRGPKLDTVTARHAAVPVMPPGMMILDHGGFTLPVGESRLLFLQRGPGGYTIVGGGQGVKPAEDADRIAKLVASFELSASLKDKVGPFYFNQPVVLQCAVKNSGDKAVRIYEPQVEGFYFSPRLGGFAQLQIVPPDKPNANLTYPITVEPGKEVVVPVQVLLTKPPSWGLFSADTYLLTPLAVRARIYTDFGPDVKTGQTITRSPAFALASAWTLTLGGFPPPAEMGK